MKRFVRFLARALPWGVVALQAWFGQRLIMQHGRSLLEGDRLANRLDQLEWMVADVASRETGSPSAARAAPPAATKASQRFPTAESSAQDTVRAHQYAHYHQLQDAALSAVPSYPSERFAGAGIVILAGGARYYTNAWVCLMMLRRVLGCRLPIQVWYLGPHEMSPHMIELLQRFDVECVDASEIRRRHPTSATGGWESKPYAILHSPFRDVILIDADNVPLIDPATLLASPEFQTTGALFWPDLHNLGAEHPIWEICRVNYRDEPEFESGQIVIDKERSWDALYLTLHLNEHSDFYYRHINGDKETFHMAWRMLGQPYSMPAHGPRWAVGSINPDDPEFADVLQQHDFDGRVIFQHRTGAKWTAWGQNLRVPGFEHEATCLEALRELRQNWDGQVDLAPALANATDHEAEILQSRYFLYRRIGSDERVLTLLPGQKVGDGGTRWEQVWRLEQGQGRATLVIGGHAGVTCRLREDADGVWRGRWLHQEQMPVELHRLADNPRSPAAARQDQAAGAHGTFA
jgi:hypothetical protein